MEPFVIVQGKEKERFRMFCIFSDDQHGSFYSLKSLRQEIEIRITPSGFIRVGKPTKLKEIN